MRVGKITKVFIVWCSTCQAEELAWNEGSNVNKDMAVKEFKKHGWEIKKDNWYCPSCSKEKGE